MMLGMRQQWVWPDRMMLDIELQGVPGIAGGDGVRQRTFVQGDTERTWSPATGIVVERVYKNRNFAEDGEPIGARRMSLKELARALGELNTARILTDTPAQLYGLKERGRIADGWKADIVVLDPETIGSHDVRMRMDLPGGAGRLYAEADGIEHVLVNGTGIVRDAKLTDARTGTLLRSGRDTETASLD